MGASISQSDSFEPVNCYYAILCSLYAPTVPLDDYMILELVKNVTLLITLCWMHGMLMRFLEGRRLLGDTSAGILFGLV